MAIRQYIGARYVPRFVGTYDPTQIYEALDVVDNGSGTSYIARKTVPAGTPLTDSSFWFVYGAASGAIIQLQNDMIQAQNDIGTLQTDVGRLTDRKFVFIGDSYGETYIDSGVTIHGWLEKIGNVMGLSASQISSDSFAVSGYGFYGDGTKTFYSKIVAMTPDNDVTDVVIIGGTNDIGDTIGTYIKDALQAIPSIFPNARIWVGFCAYRSVWDAGQTYMKTLDDYCEYSSHYGAIFMDSLQYCLYNKAYELNSTHPNNNGTDVMTNAISTILKGGRYRSIVPKTEANMNPDTYCKLNLATCKHYFEIDDNMVRFMIYGANERIEYRFESGDVNITADGNNAVVITKFDNIPFGYGQTNLGVVPAFIMTNDSGGAIRPASVLLYLNHYYLMATVIAVNNSADAFWNFGNTMEIQRIHFQPCSFEFPLLPEGIEHQ